MTKHKLLINWFLLYIIILCLGLSLIFYFEAIRIQIAIILLILLISFIFYPIYHLDKRISEKDNKEHVNAKSKEIRTTSNEQEKVKEEGRKKEPETDNEIINLNPKEEELNNKIKIYCTFCGKKIDEDAKICPYCGISL
jgi:energy-coupling factor transporter transmembrane protein EcfT